MSTDADHPAPGRHAPRRVNPADNLELYVAAVAATAGAEQGLLGRHRNAVTVELQLKRDRDRDRLLAFLLEHGASRVHGGHVSLARRVAKTGLIRVFRSQQGFAAEILPGKEEEVRELLASREAPQELTERERDRARLERRIGVTPSHRSSAG